MSIQNILNELEKMEIKEINYGIDDNFKLARDAKKAIYFDKFLSYYGLTPTQARNLGLRFVRLEHKDHGWIGTLAVNNIDGYKEKEFMILNIMHDDFDEIQHFMQFDVLLAAARKFTAPKKPVTVKLSGSIDIHVSFD